MSDTVLTHYNIFHILTLRFVDRFSVATEEVLKCLKTLTGKDLESYEHSLCHGTVIQGVSNNQSVVSQGGTEIG